MTTTTSTVALLTSSERRTRETARRQMEKLDIRNKGLIAKRVELEKTSRELVYIRDLTPEQSTQKLKISKELQLVVKAQEKLQIKYRALQKSVNEVDAIGELEKRIGEITYILSLGERLAKVAPEVISPIFGTVLTAFMDVGDTIEPELQRGRVAHAKRLHAKFQAYREVGFDEEQAMRLLLASIKPTTFAEQVSSTVAATGNAVQEGKKVVLR